MRTKNYRTRKNHSRKRKQHRSRMVRRKSRAYGRRKMSGGAWFQIRNGAQIPVDSVDVSDINRIVSGYRNKSIRSTPGNNNIDETLPSNRRITFKLGNHIPGSHMIELTNMKYATKNGSFDLVEVNESPASKITLGGPSGAVDSTGRPI
jgi:hypothetical protein